MNINLEEKLVQTYPKLFNCYHLPPEQSCMSFGCDCGDGWYKLIDDACKKITFLSVKTKLNVVFDQIKEKYGKLRIYWHTEIDEENSNIDTINLFETIIDDIILSAEYYSKFICENCSNQTKLKEKNGCFSTTCETCDSK